MNNLEVLEIIEPFITGGYLIVVRIFDSALHDDLLNLSHTSSFLSPMGLLYSYIHKIPTLREICYTGWLKKFNTFLYYFKELTTMIKITLYHKFKEYSFEGEGHLTYIGEVEDSDNIHMKIDFDESYESALCDFLRDIPSGTKCRIWDNDGKYFNGEYVTKSRIDKNPLVTVSKISRYI